MDSEKAILYGGLHMFSKPILKAYRDAVVDCHIGPQLKAAIKTVRSTAGFTVDGEQYKRIPRGYDPDHPRAQLLRFNTLYVSSPVIKPAVLASPELVDVVMDHCEKTAAVQQWLVKVKLGASA